MSLLQIGPLTDTELLSNPTTARFFDQIRTYFPVVIVRTLSVVVPVIAASSTVDVTITLPDADFGDALLQIIQDRTPPLFIGVPWIVHNPVVTANSTVVISISNPTAVGVGGVSVPYLFFIRKKPQVAL